MGPILFHQRSSICASSDRGVRIPFDVTHNAIKRSPRCTTVFDEIVGTHAAIIVTVNQHEAVLVDQRSTAENSERVERYAIHRARDSCVVGTFDFGPL